jgi:hypothetical protein
MKTNYTLSFLVMLGVFTASIAQNSEELLFRVLDLETKQPISFATIIFAGGNNGVIADEEGEFRLPIKHKSINSTILISSIGFETLKMDSSNMDQNKINIIYLSPKVETLNSVLVIAKTKSSTPTEIIEEAISRIVKNYPVSSHSYIGYYRDYQLVNSDYYNLNESILETFDAGFRTDKLKNTQNVTAKYYYETNDNYYLDTLLLESIYGDSKVVNKDESAKFSTTLINELEILNLHNPIRNFNTLTFSFVDKLSSDFVDNHTFTLEGIKYINDTPLYEIAFNSNEIAKSKFRAIGKIYISKTNYAIYKFEYKMIENSLYSVSGINKNETLFKGGKINIVDEERLSTVFEVNIEYKPINEKMYLNYISFNNKFIIKEPNPFDVANFEFDPSDLSFYITFNKPVDSTSIKRTSQFKLSYKNQRLIVKNVELIKQKVVKVEVVNWSAGNGAELKALTSEGFSYKLKNMKDISGKKIYKKSKLIGFQFREFFTQEVFEGKKPPSDLTYVMKSRPLSESKINSPSFDIEKYWLNSPLKQNKEDN